MAATRTANAVKGRTETEALFQEEGCSAARSWSNAPGDTYGWHAHDYHKVLFCQEGSITFHTRHGDVEMRAGDRLDIEPGTEHAASVGPQGVSCVEAARA
jgi:quercetin dioxygenase-like cupin family protein